MTWAYRFPLNDTLTHAKGLAARVLDELLREGKADDANFTNWPSIVAALQRILKDWSDKLRASYLAQDSAQTPILHS